VIAGMGIWVTQGRFARTSTPATISAAAAQTSEGGSVTVVVTPQTTDDSVAFTVALDTHSVDLDGYDLREIALLRVDGRELRPTAWDAPKGGHHRQGTLVFPASPPGGSMELVIRDVAGIAERSFRWPSQ
jgi:hypothetical protein